jgi:transcriptional regulator with XRE-family HTH domain
MKIGQAIKTLRKQLNISQMKLSEMTKISQTALSKIERAAKPSDENIKKICKALDVPEIVLFILASEGDDIAEDKKDKFRALQSLIKNMALDLVDVHHAELLKKTQKA